MSVFFLSLEDELVRRFGGERMKSLYNLFKIDEDTCLESRMLSRGIENAQKNIEGRNFGIRKNVLQYDDVMNTQRKVMYEERLNVLKGADVHEQVLKYIPDYVEEVVRSAVNVEDMPEALERDGAECRARGQAAARGYQLRHAREADEVGLSSGHPQDHQQDDQGIRKEDRGHQGRGHRLPRRGAAGAAHERGPQLDRPHRRDGSAPQGDRPARLRPGGPRHLLQERRLRDVRRDGGAHSAHDDRGASESESGDSPRAASARPPSDARSGMASAPAANAASAQPPRPRPLRRQMPEPLTNMSSYKEAMARREALLKAQGEAKASEKTEAQTPETQGETDGTENG